MYLFNRFASCADRYGIKLGRRNVFLTRTFSLFREPKDMPARILHRRKIHCLKDKGVSIFDQCIYKDNPIIHPKNIISTFYIIIDFKKIKNGKNGPPFKY